MLEKNVFGKKARAVSSEAAHNTIISADSGQLSALSQSWPDPQVQICILKNKKNKNKKRHSLEGK